MPKLKWFAAAMLTMAGVSMAADPQPVKGDSQYVPAGYEKVFADEMDTPKLDTLNGRITGRGSNLHE